LSTFHPDERPAIEQALDEAADAVEQVLAEGAIAAMNRYNARE
jgi:peptidyl-tRNA hydrolase